MNAASGTLPPLERFLDATGRAVDLRAMLGDPDVARVLRGAGCTLPLPLPSTGPRSAGGRGPGRGGSGRQEGNHLVPRDDPAVANLVQAYETALAAGPLAPRDVLRARLAQLRDGRRRGPK